MFGEELNPEPFPMFLNVLVFWFFLMVRKCLKMLWTTEGLGFLILETHLQMSDLSCGVCHHLSHTFLRSIIRWNSFCKLYTGNSLLFSCQTFKITVWLLFEWDRFSYNTVDIFLNFSYIKYKMHLGYQMQTWCFNKGRPSICMFFSVFEVSWN